MKSKRPESTADRLLKFRERLRAHYRAVRSQKCKPVPKPSVQEFDPSIRKYAEIIEGEESSAHEAILKEPVYAKRA